MRKLLAPYFKLQGRSSRREWWIIEILVVLGFKLNVMLYDLSVLDRGGFGLGEKLSQAWVLFSLTLLWLNTASNVRRLHDRGKSGWWSLIFFVPGLGQMWCFIECGFLKGQPHANKYGPVPGGQHNEFFTALSGSVPKVAAFEQRATLTSIRESIAAIIKAGTDQRAAVKATATTKMRPSTLPNTSASTARTQRPEPRRRSVLAAQSSGAVTRIDHTRRSLTAAAIIGIAIVLGAGAVFFSAVDVERLVPPIDASAFTGTFKSGDEQLVPLNKAND